MALPVLQAEAADILNPLSADPAYNAIRKQMEAYSAHDSVRHELPFLTNLYRCAAQCVEMKQELDVLLQENLSSDARRLLTRSSVALYSEWSNPVPFILNVAEGIEDAISEKMEIIRTLINHHPHYQPLEVLALVAAGQPLSDLFRTSVILSAGHAGDGKTLVVIPDDCKDIPALVQQWRNECFQEISALVAEGKPMNEVVMELHVRHRDEADSFKKLQLQNATIIAKQEFYQHSVVASLALTNPLYVPPANGTNQEEVQLAPGEEALLASYQEQVIGIYTQYTTALEEAHQALAGLVRPAPSSDHFCPQPVHAINQEELDRAIARAIYQEVTGRDPNQDFDVSKVSAVLRDDGAKTAARHTAF